MALSRTQQLAATGNITDYGTYAFRNKIINGDFDFWQEATSLVSGTGVRHAADLWWNNSGGTTYTTTANAFAYGQTSVPDNPSYYITTTVTSVAGSSNFCNLAQKIENVRTLSAVPCTFSFWAKADTNKNIAVEFYQYFGTGGSPSAPVTGLNVTTCSLSTSWKKFTINVNLPSISGKTLGTNYDSYFTVVFWLDAGSAYNARTNSLGQQSGTFDIAHVQIEQGLVATPFEQKPYAVEYSLCRRILQIHSFVAGSIIASGSAGNSTAALAPYYFTPMRSTPTITLPVSGSSAGQATFIDAGWNTPAGFGTNAPQLINNSAGNFRIYGYGYTGLTSTGMSLFMTINGASIKFDARLP